jgi:hypothetical protein
MCTKASIFSATSYDRTIPYREKGLLEISGQNVIDVRARGCTDDPGIVVVVLLGDGDAYGSYIPELACEATISAMKAVETLAE